jgi:hypothetical protein
VAAGSGCGSGQEVGEGLGFSLLYTANGASQTVGCHGRWRSRRGGAGEWGAAGGADGAATGGRPLPCVDPTGARQTIFFSVRLSKDARQRDFCRAFFDRAHNK